MILSHVSENLIIWNVYSLFLYVVFLVLKKKLPCLLCQDFPGGSEVKNPPAMQETWVQSLNWGDPLEKGMATTPVLLLGESHGQRSLVATVHRIAKSQTRLSN